MKDSAAAAAEACEGDSARDSGETEGGGQVLREQTPKNPSSLEQRSSLVVKSSIVSNKEEDWGGCKAARHVHESWCVQEEGGDDEEEWEDLD